MVHFDIAHQRQHDRRFAIPLHLDVDLELDLQKRAAETVQEDAMVFRKRQSRLTPQEIASMQSELSASAARAAQTQATQQTTAVRGGGANPATAGTTVRTDATTRSVAPTYSVGAPLEQTRSSTSAVTTSSSSTAARQLTSSARSTTSTTTTSTISSSTSSSTLSTPSVRTITTSSTMSSATPVPQPSSTAESAEAGSSSGLGTGAVVGIVLAVLIGVVILGSAFGWLYRKFASRGYKDNARWRKLDEDITPYPSSGEKYHDRSDDIYGGAAAPVIGSNRALANSMQRDTYGSNHNRPMTEYDMYQRNRAGVGSGMEGHDAYPQQNSPYDSRPAYSPYPGQGLAHQQYGYPDEKQSPPGSRQLLGGANSPYGHGQQQMMPELTPVPIGRPAAPDSYADIAHREDYADELPSPSDYPPHAFSTAAPVGVQLYDRPAGATPTAPVAPPAPLPTFRPMSSFANSFNFDNTARAQTPTRQSPEAPMYADDEQYRQKQLYGEVSRAAGFAEPKTPHSARTNSMNMSMDHSFVSTGATGNMSSSMDTTMDNSMVSTASSFSVPERLPASAAQVHAVTRAPAGVMQTPIQMPAPGPYEHGRPLSPLVEVATPSTSFSVTPANVGGAPMASMASSSIGHGREVNPFDHLQPAQHGQGRTLVAPPHSAASSTAATGFPSARFPPPSPGGMSVPGSVGGSPRDAVQRKSVYDEEDAYGGI